MEPISGIIASAAHSTAAAAGVKEASQVQQPEDKIQSRPLTPVRDEYIPEEKREPTGRYWLGKSEDGQPKICFDDPEQDRGIKAPDKKASGGQAERCVCDTGRVDREIEKLKREQEELGRQLNSETDDTRRKDLERKLAQIEQELSQKDNDTYRRQNAVFS